MECENNALLENLFTSPLVTQDEVKDEYSEVLRCSCEKGAVGCKVFQKDGRTSKVYWIKSSVLKETSSPSVAPPHKRKFMSPLPHQRPSKKRRCRNDAEISGDNFLHGRNVPSSCMPNEASLLAKEHKCLLQKVEEKKEKLRKLELVKMYRVKNNLEELAGLVDKWRGVAQEVAEELLAKSSRLPPPSMTELLEHLHIDPALLHYSTDEEEFY